MMCRCVFQILFVAYSSVYTRTVYNVEVIGWYCRRLDTICKDLLVIERRGGRQHPHKQRYGVRSNGARVHWPRKLY